MDGQIPQIVNVEPDLEKTFRNWSNFAVTFEEGLAERAE
jgi:hypothetical protein